MNDDEVFPQGIAAACSAVFTGLALEGFMPPVTGGLAVLFGLMAVMP